MSATQGHLGFMAFIAHYDAAGQADYLCSGAVISVNVVLTAGHCALDVGTGVARDVGGYRVVTGAVDWTDTVNRHVSGVARVIVDPAFNPAAKVSDAALLVLSTPTTAPAIRLAGSTDQGLEQAGTGAVIAGWGETSAGETSLTHVLQWASTVVQSPAYCGQFSASYDPSVELCAADSPHNDTGTCNGDSGGPLLASDAAGQPVEIGVLSTGPADCNTVSADYFTAVRPLSSWAQGWISTVAPPPQLPSMTFSDARAFVFQTVARAVGPAFKREHAYGTTCTRRSAVRVGCSVSFRSGPNGYWGTVTVYYVLGSNNAVEWNATYTMRRVNYQCYHSKQHARCRITTRHGSW